MIACYEVVIVRLPNNGSREPIYFMILWETKIFKKLICEKPKYLKKLIKILILLIIIITHIKYLVKFYLMLSNPIMLLKTNINI